MILEISTDEENPINPKLTWKEAFKQSIYKKNL